MGQGTPHTRAASYKEPTPHGLGAQPDGCSEDGDEDCKPLEVMFDPASSHRRKSSLVSSDPVVTRSPQWARRDQCLVHQFLESQRRASGRYPKDRTQNAHAHGRNHAADRDARGDDSADGAVESQESEALVEQADEQAQTRGMTEQMSDLDVSHSDDVHSRMLTKKQLSDMAWGVRNLSRRLSSMRIRFRVKSIFILTKVYDHDLIPKTRELVRWLLERDRPVAYVVYIQDKLKTHKRFDAGGLLDDVARGYASDSTDVKTVRDALEHRLRHWDEDMCKTRPHTFDFVITLGGDGTVLYASWLFQRIVPPVLSFALGSLGFLTKFDFDDYTSTLKSSFERGVTVSLRLRFECTTMRSVRRLAEEPTGSSEEDEDEAYAKRDLVEELVGEERDDAHTHRPDGTYEILNEVVVDRGPNPTMSYTEVFGDDEHFTSVLADGICVSTPTGSTAYNLAAGGSLCHPENPVMLLTSICAHTLSFRPIILPDTIVLRVGVPYDARTSSWASFDGRERVELRPGDYVTISASRYPFASVQAEGRRSEDWVNSISGKLGWNTRQKQKELKKWDG
ncbi:hypothetical protein HIM_00404 [Hirsutella minnesotensis 3608]|nr:hypothetical protein HIM_00404 [Hirsutella minnesotensis 3608]